MTDWPWPGDTALTIARRVAVAYRTHLHAANPAVCDALDAAMRDYGQHWVLPTPVVDGDGMGAVTTREAAARAGVSVDVIRQWACTPHPDDPTRALLPRFRRAGRERTYLIADVDTAAALVATRRAARRRAG